MNWDAIGAIAETVGAVAVVVTLIYLAIQIRQQTMSVRAATELESSRIWTDFHARVSHSPDMTLIWDKGLTGEEQLTDSEKRKFIWLIAEYFILVEGLFRQREIGYLSEASWARQEQTAAGVLRNELVRRWWDSGVTPQSPDFRRCIDVAVERYGDQAWSYTPLSEL